MSDIDNGVCSACVGSGLYGKFLYCPPNLVSKPKTNKQKKMNSSIELFKNF